MSDLKHLMGYALMLSAVAGGLLVLFFIIGDDRINENVILYCSVIAAVVFIIGAWLVRKD